jgi:hypothetical protein
LPFIFGAGETLGDWIAVVISADRAQFSDTGVGRSLVQINSLCHSRVGLGGPARQMSANVFHPSLGRPDCVADNASQLRTSLRDRDGCWQWGLFGERRNTRRSLPGPFWVCGRDRVRSRRWRAKFKAEPQPPALELLYRRGSLSHTLSHSPSHRLSSYDLRLAGVGLSLPKKSDSCISRWCSLPRIGCATLFPNRSIARVDGVFGSDIWRLWPEDG